MTAFELLFSVFRLVIVDHQVEMDRLKESHRLDCDQLVAEQDDVIRQLEARHLAQLVSCRLKIFRILLY